MKILAAPIIHARTRDVDFRAGLLVKPEDFSDDRTRWARKYILDSTRFFELAGPEGRWAAFCDQKVAVAGVSIRIGQLYRLCGKEPKYDKVNGKRTNYAFIGIAVPKSEIGEAFQVTYPMLLDIFEKYMALRWEEGLDNSALEATRAGYEPMEVPGAEAVCKAQFADFSKRQVYDFSIGTAQSLVSRMLLEMKNHDELSFCWDMPNERSIRDSGFTVVTSRVARGGGLSGEKESAAASQSGGVGEKAASAETRSGGAGAKTASAAARSGGAGAKAASTAAQSGSAGAKAENAAAGSGDSDWDGQQSGKTREQKAAGAGLLIGAAVLVAAAAGLLIWFL